MHLTFVSDDSGVVRIRNEGRMTSADFEAGHRDPLEALLGPTCYAMKVLLDLRDTSFIDSFAIGWLINRNRQFKEKGGKLVLHSIPPSVQKVFDLLKMGVVFTIAANEHEAKEFLAGAQT